MAPTVVLVHVKFMNLMSLKDVQIPNVYVGSFIYDEDRGRRNRFRNCETEGARGTVFTLEMQIYKKKYFQTT